MLIDIKKQYALIHKGAKPIKAARSKALSWAKGCCLTALAPTLLMSTNAVQATVTFDGGEGTFNQIFTSNCATSGCHDGSQSPDLTNFSAASSNSVLIASRMNNSGSPMPPSGLLSATLRTLASSWNSDGALQNATPQVITNGATSIDEDSATLNATLFENGIDTSMVFEYSTNSALTGALTSSTSSGGGTGGGISGASISIGISSLSCGTTYYYRGMSNANGTFIAVNGSNGIQNFTTSACPNSQPVITSTAVTAATEDVQYSYQVVVTDADDSSFTYGLSNEPSGMVISASGLITWTPADGVTTSGLVTVSAADGGEDGVTPATQSFTVSVTAVNDPPSITSSAPTTATEDTLYTYTASATDVDDTNDGSGLTWSLSNEPSGMVVSSTGVVTWTPANGISSSGAVTLSVEDGDEDSSAPDTEIFTIAVTAVNDPPTITSTAATTGTEDTLYTYTASATDVDDTNDGSGLIWSLSNEPSGMVVSSTGVVTWTPANGISSSGAVTLSVEDGDEDSSAPDTEIFTIAVTAVNDPPTITSTAATTGTEDTLYTYTASATDVDDTNDGSGLTWSLSNEPSGMVVSSTGVVTWTPANGISSSGVVTLSVEDGDEDSSAPDTEIFTIAVTAVNDPPTITSTAATTGTEDTLYTYTASASDVDDTNDGSGLTWSLSNEPSGMVVSSTGVVTWTPANGILSSGAVTLIVEDGDEDSSAPDTEIFTIAVTAVNDPPSITSSAPTSAVEGNTYTYNAAVNDVDDSNDGTGLVWSLTNEPSGMLVSSTGQITWTPGNNISSSGAVTLNVIDGGEDGSTGDSQIFTVSVSAFNTPPIITSTAPTSATEDTLYNYQLAVSDNDDANDGASITYALSNEPAGMSVSSTGLVTWTPTEGISSSGTVTITVADGGEDGAGPDSEAFTISVTSVNDAPVISSTAGTTATEDTLFSYTPTVSDPDDANDGSQLSWSLSNEPSGMAISSTGAITWTPAEGVLSSGLVTVSVADGGEDGASPGTESFTVAVTAVNDGPTLTSTAPTSATEDVLYSYTASVSDPDDSNNGSDLIWSLADEPSGMMISTTGVVTWTPENGVTTSGSVTLSVADDGENSAVAATESFTLSVTAVNDAPIITSVASTSALEANEYSYQVTVADPDDSNNGTDINFNLSNAPVDMAISTTGLITWVPPEDTTSSGTITLTVSDGGEDGAVADTESFTITVSDFNSPPSITSTAPTTASEDIEYTYQVAVSDVDDPNNGTDLTFNLSNAPSGMTVSNTGLISWTATEGVLSSGNVTVSAADGGENSAPAATETFSVAVTAINDAPVISSAASTTARETNPYSYQVTVTDPDDNNNGSDLSFALTNAPVDMSVSSMGLITWTPPEGTTSSGEITLTVSDGGEDGAAAATQPFTVAVGIFNNPPTITSSAPTTATEDIEYTYQLAVNDIDDPNNGTDLSYSLTDAPAGMEISSTGLISWTPLEGVSDANSITATVVDGGEDDAAPSSETFSITVTSVNDAPTISSAAPTAVVELNLYTYQLSVVDPDDTNDGTGALSYALANAPTGMTISDTGLIEWTPEEGLRSSGEITTTVSDGGEDGAAQAEERFTISVIEFNTPPTITSQATNSATEDVEYSYQVVIDDLDDANDGSGALSFSLDNAPEGMEISNMGLVTWTPTEGITTSGGVTLSASDGGEDDAPPAQETFTLTITPVNDAPIIISTAPTTVNEDEQYRYQLEVSDPDDSNENRELNYSLSNAPSGMRVSSLGLITWDTDENSPSASTITVSVVDGAEDGVQPVSETFSVTVVFDIDGDGIANDADNCRSIANPNQENNDQDSNGDACDSDDDNDGISDEFEVANGLDPFDASDANEDPDNDGQTNAEEFDNNGDPNIDDIPPVLTAPADIQQVATGFETFVEIGNAIATDTIDGPVVAAPNRSSGPFRTGRNIVTWTATDSQGNTASVEQNVDITPLISVSAEQSAEEGQTVEIRFALNGDPVRFPVTVDFQLSGTASQEDHNITARRVELDSNEGSISVDIRRDDEQEAEESLVLTLSNPSNAALGGNIVHTLTIIESNVAPSATLSVEQSSIPGLIAANNGGLITVTALVSDPNEGEVFSYDWSDSDNRLSSEIGEDEDRFVIDPALLEADIYKVSLTVTDGQGAEASNDVLIRITDDTILDANSNGIDDAVDSSEEAFVLQADTEGKVLETESTLAMRLGETAVYARTDSAAISLEQLMDFGDGGQPTNAQTGFQFSGDLFDFEITGLSKAGQSATVVLPLDAEIPEQANYQKYTASSGWNLFVEDEKNVLASARTENGLCPGPGTDNYTPGLTAGDNCLQLTIEDGGPNDADGEANAVVRDPGGVGVQPSIDNTPDSVEQGSSGGGGATHMNHMIYLFLLTVLGRLYRRRTAL